jgi:hypothetical protein
VGTILTSNRLITETGDIDTANIHIYNISFMVTQLLLGEWWGHVSVFHKWVK